MPGRFDDRGKMCGTAVNQIVPIHRGNHDMAQAQPCYSLCHTLRLTRIQRQGHTRADIAERAGTCADFPHMIIMVACRCDQHSPILDLDGNVPRGICLFTPDETQQHYLTELEDSLPWHAAAGITEGELPITGVYTMGSTSSVGQSCSSDLDIWVCHQSWLDNDERQLLQRKCSLLEKLGRVAWRRSQFLPD